MQQWLLLLAPVSGKWFDVKGPLKPLLTGLILASIGGVLISFFFERLAILPLLALNIILMSGNGFVMGSNVTFCLMQLDKDVKRMEIVSSILYSSLQVRFLQQSWQEFFLQIWIDYHCWKI